MSARRSGRDRDALKALLGGHESGQPPVAASTTVGPNSGFQIRPDFERKFRPTVVKSIIHEVLEETLNGKSFESDQVSGWCTAIADVIKQRLKELGYDRYKFVVEVVIGEQRGEGVHMSSRCLWDADTDNFASDVFINDALFSCAAAFALFYY